MANELRIETQFEYRKNDIIHDKHDSAYIDIGSDAFDAGVQTITTSNTKVMDLTGSSITSWGYMYLRNLDSTNFVRFGALDDGSYFLKLKAGEFALFRAARSSMYAKADTDSVDVEMLILQD